MSVHLLVTTRQRAPTRLDLVLPERPDPDVDAIRAAAGGERDGILLSGGEPTLRPDLPRLVEALAPVGLATDGLPLSEPRVVDGLVGLGLSRVRVPLHAARLDAHDWLVGLPGAGRRAVQALRTCAPRVAVEVEVVLTRPTTPYLAETVELLARLGVQAVRFRRLTRRGPAADDFLALSPRLGLLEPYLEAALELADRRGLQAEVEGLPRCVLPRGRIAGVEPRLAPGALADLLLPPIAAASRCEGCPPECGGVPEDYVRCFGWGEIAVSPDAAARPGPTAAAEPAEPADSPTLRAATGRRLGVVPAPPVRGPRPPATRVRFASTQAARRLEGDPLAGVPRGPVPPTLRLSWSAPSRVRCPACGDGAIASIEPSRQVRRRLVRAAQVGAARLRLTGAGLLAHPDAPALLREAVRLSFPVVEVAGEGSALDAWSDAELRRLRGIARVDLALYGPDATSHDEHTGRPGSFEAALRGAERLARHADVPVATFAVLRDGGHAVGFAEGWATGALPGRPAFRLAACGGALEEVIAAADRLEGEARSALLAVLPRCRRPASVPAAEGGERAWADPDDPAAEPSGSDPAGTYVRCCSDSGCRGTAVGWGRAAPSA